MINFFIVAIGGFSFLVFFLSGEGLRSEDVEDGD